MTADDLDASPVYLQQVGVRHSLVTATVVVALVGTFLMAVCSNLPLTMAPGMGVNAFFAISMVGYLGGCNILLGAMS